MLSSELGQIVEDQPKPRALLVDLDPDIGAAVTGIFPYELSIDSSIPFYEPDYDCYVTASHGVTELRRHCGIAFGSMSITGVGAFKDEDAADGVYPGSSVRNVVREVQPTTARDLHVPEGLPSAIKDLVRRDLLPLMEDRQRRLPLRARNSSSVSSHRSERFIESFLNASDGSILAGRLRRVSHNLEQVSEVWILPSGLSRPADWVRLAWRFWADYDPSLPSPPVWSDEASWYSPEERLTKSRIDAVARERDEALVRFSEREAVLLDEFSQNRGKADSGARRLLVAQGDALVEAVAETLRTLDLAVTDMDARWPQGDKREDLRAALGSDWEAIIEVRGYRGGAQLNDFLRLSRFARRYLDDEGKWPSARWYIVNSFINRDPGARQKPLASNEAEVVALGEDDSLVIDTIDLYRLWQAIGSDRISLQVARESLTGQRGRFVLPEDAQP